MVIPAYRAEATIGQAIDSVLAQTYGAAEILVIDDASPEDLAPALAPYAAYVTLIRQPHGGAAAARNRGIDRATGDAIAFLDADDQWMPDKLSRCADILLADSRVGMIASRYVLQDSEDRSARTAGPRQQWCGRPLLADGRQLMDFAKATSTPTVVVRRQLLEHHRFDTTLKTAEDRDLWLRLLAETRVYFLESPLTVVHLRSGSLSHANLDVDCRCMLRVIDRYRHLLGTLSTRRERSLVHWRWAVGLRRGRPALQQLARSMWQWPLPYSPPGSPCRWARPRTLAAILRRGCFGE